MEIGSKEWKEKRRATVGSSDAPVIMRVSPYKSPYQLWEEKVFGKEQTMNGAMFRGNKLEESARHCFEKKFGIEVFPEVLKHPEINWMTATVDGISSNRKHLVEIKCPNRNDHQSAKDGKIPQKYYPQCQHQLEVSGLDSMYYFSFDGDDGVIVEVEKDKKYISNLIKEEKAFWDCINNLEAPEFTDLDWVDMDGDENWQELAPRYKEIDKILEELEEERTFLRAQFVLFSSGRNAKGCGIKLTKSMTKGAIEYSKIPEIQSVDVEKYRKPSYVKWRTSILT
jgi:putative phage-type endonuclease